MLKFYNFTKLIIRVRIQLEKAPVRGGIIRTSEKLEKSKKEVLSEITGGARRTARGEPGGSQMTPGTPPRPRLVGL